MRILITRPSENVSPITYKLLNQGHEVMIDSLIKIIPENPQLPELSSFDAIITTSQQAIRCLSTLTPQRDFPLWCVGTESAQIAGDLGFKKICTAEGSAKTLIQKLTDSASFPALQKVLYASGDVTRVHLPHILKKKGIKTHHAILYKTQAKTSFSEESYHALQSRALDAVLFYSPRTAHIFQTLCKESQLEFCYPFLKAFCLSNTIQKTIQDLPWKKIYVAKKNTTDDLLMCLMMAE